MALAAGLLAAMALSVCCWFAFRPSRLHLLASTDLLGVALLGALFASGLPLITLWLVALRRPLTPAASALLAATWLLTIVFWRAAKPWDYFGVFPTWMLYRDFLQALPTALAAGLVFGLVARGRSSAFRADKP